MSLPYDVARCAGNGDVACDKCARRQAGDPDRQLYLAPKARDGFCEFRIASVDSSYLRELARG